MKGALSQTPHFYWEGEGSNPYFGILGLAEYLVVTSDSVNMVSEAFATGKPVYVVPMRGGSAKFERFHRGAREAGLTRPFTGPLERYSYAPPSDLSAVTERVGRLLGRGRPAAGAGDPPPGGFDFP